MKNYSICLAAFLAAIFFYSCQEKSKDHEVYFVKRSNFDETIALKKWKRLETPFMSMKPRRLVLAPPYIFYSDSGDENVFVAVNIKSPEKSQKTIRNGEGPNELTSINSINVLKDSVVILNDAQTGRYLRLPYHDGFDLIPTAKNIPRLNRISPIIKARLWKDSLLVSYNLGINKLRFEFIDTAFQSTGIRFASYPLIDDVSPRLDSLKHYVMVLGNLFEPKFRINQNTDQLFVLSPNANIIEVFNLQNRSREKIIVGPGGNYPVRWRYNSRMTGVPCKDCVRGYNDISFFDDRIYALYSGKLASERESWGCREVHVFDKSWNPLTVLRLPFEATALQIDPKGRMYLMSPFSEFPVVYTDL